MTQYAVFLHEDPETFRKFTPSEMQAIIQRYTAWGDRLRASGRYVSGKKLADDGGKSVRLEKGRMTVSDGPYAETKDIVGGLFVFTADSYEDALSVISDCPHLEYGRIELRAIEIDGDAS